MTYTTEQLISILDQELRATWKGERIVLSLEERIDYPVLAQALDPAKLSRVYAYQDFRTQIHEYQKLHRVSGIIWRESTFQNQTIRFPEIHNQLIAIPGDKEKLASAKTLVLNFWQNVTSNLHFWLAGDRPQPISRDLVNKFTQEAEWAEIDATRQEIYLGLCWGNPKEYQYKWAKPESGCHRIIATTTEPSALKIC